MSFTIKMYVLGYLLSLCASLETGLNVLKSTNITVSSLSEELNITSQRNIAYTDNGADAIDSEVLKSSEMPKREGIHKRLQKMQNLHSERRRNRARKRKELTGATKFNYAGNKEKVKTVSDGKFYESKIFRRYNVTTSIPGKMETLGVDPTSQNTPPAIQNKSALESFKVTSRPVTMTLPKIQTTDLGIRKETRPSRVLEDKADAEGRSKNRPQRNRHKKLYVSNTNSNRHGHRISKMSGHRSKHNKQSSEDSKRIESRPDRTGDDEASGGDVKMTLNEGDGPTKEACPTCGKAGLSEETVRQIRLDMFIETMADKLRVSPKELMARRSKRRRNPRFPRVLVEETLQDNAMQRHTDHYHVEDQKVILPGRDMAKACIAKKTSGCYSFKLAGNIKGDVAEAQLWVYKTPDKNDTDVQTFMLYGMEKLRNGKMIAQNQIQRHDSNVREGWVVIDITRIVTSWVQERKSVETIAIRCATCVTRNHKALYGTKHGYTPLIIIKYDKAAPQHRHRRSNDDCDPETDCCKRELNVNFREIYMHNVVAPPDLSVGYCYGACNELRQINNNHTMIKQKFRIQSEDTTAEMREMIKPCCVPIAFKDTLIMLTSSTSPSYVVTKLPGVIVEECGCV